MGIKKKGVIRVKGMKHANDSDAPQYDMDPSRWMTRKERQLWKRLPDKKKQQYIDQAQSKVLIQNLGYGHMMDAENEELKKDLKKKELKKKEQVKLQKYNNQKIDDKKQDIQSDQKVYSGGPADTRKPVAKQSSSFLPSTSNSNNIGADASKRVIKTSGNKVADKTAQAATMAVPAGKVVTAAKEVTKEVGKMLSYSARTEELQNRQQREEAIAETVALDFSEDTKGLVNTIRTLSIIAIAQVQLVMTLIFPAIIATVVVLTLIYSLMTFFAGIIEEENRMSAQHIVQVALNEEELGEDVTKGGQKYWSYMGFSSRVPWCASFVSWCANAVI